MSRRLIIAILILLIIGIIGGTVAFISSRLQSSPTPEATNTNQPGGLQESGTGNQNIIDPTGDSDSDGLNNSDEQRFG